MRVLLADDHAVVREGLRFMLSTDPEIQVVGEASTGSEALELVEALAPDVVVMDLRMPGMDGVEATRRTKAAHPSIAVVILTVYNDEAHVTEAIRAGASAFLVKDASRELLCHTIRVVQSGGLLFGGSHMHDALSGMERRMKGPTPLGDGQSGLVEELTRREQEVLVLLAEGATNKGIAAALSITDITAKKHVLSIISKLGAARRTEAVVKAMRAGLVASPAVTSLSA